MIHKNMQKKEMISQISCSFHAKMTHDLICFEFFLG
jgi:hypothetical protein